MKGNQSQRFAGIAVILMVGLALWLLLRDEPDTSAVRPTVTVPDAEIDRSPRQTPIEQSNVAVESPPARDRAEVEWYAALRSITPADLEARERRKDRRIAAFLVQQRIEELGLDYQQSPQLRELLSRRFDFESDFRARMKSEGVSADTEEFERRRSKERSEIDAQIESLVGTERVTEATKESHRLEMRLYAVEMAGESALQGVPLTPSQRVALNDRIAQISVNGPRTNPTDPADPRLGANLYDMEVFTALEEILSKRQIEVFQDIKYEEHLYQEAERRIESQKLSF